MVPPRKLPKTGFGGRYVRGADSRLARFWSDESLVSAFDPQRLRHFDMNMDMDTATDDFEFDIDEDASDIEMEDHPDEEWPIDDDEDDQEVNWQEQPIQWTKTPERNILKKREGLTSYSKNANTHLEAFKLFISENISNVILTHTNHRANEDNFDQVDEVEFDAFIGLLIGMGVTKQATTDIRKLWSPDYLGFMPLYAATISRNRFAEIFRKIRFDDKATREQRRQESKLAAIKDVSDLLAKNCIDSYITGEDNTIDEGMTGFKGKCPFRVYMPKKPQRYGIKNWILADAKSRYIKNFTVYTGKEGNQVTTNLGLKVVSELVQVLDEGRNVTCDNFFTSYRLAKYLSHRRLTLLGTVNKNRKEVPSEMVDAKTRVVDTSNYLFTKLATLVSYVPRKNKSVVLLSSSHVQFLEGELSATGKPRIILDYNATKGGVDTIDQMRQEYSCARATRRWTMAQFLFYIDLAAINAFHIHQKVNRLENSSRSDFLLELCKQLVAPHISRRRSIGYSGIHSEQQNAIEKVYFILFPDQESMSQEQNYSQESSSQSKKQTQKGCFICKNRTRVQCQKCARHCCNIHSKHSILCIRCSPN